MIVTRFFVGPGTPTRTVTTLPQGVRLTPTAAVKNCNAIPVNVVTSSTGGSQVMYVVQQTSPLMTTAQGGQKTVLLNFQPGNSILSKFCFEFFLFCYFNNLFLVDFFRYLIVLVYFSEFFPIYLPVFIC